MSDQQHIKGDIVYVKVSGEPVCILEYHSGANLYDCRRKVSSKTKLGPRYVTDSFYGFELESHEDHLLKRKQEMDDLASALKGAGAIVVDDRPKGPSLPPSFDNKTH